MPRSIGVDWSVENSLFNGSTSDLERNNVQGTLLASAARTTSAISPQQTNYNARGVIVTLNVTAASGTGGLTLRIQTLDPVSGAIINLLVGTAIIANGIYGYVVYPGASGGTAGPNSIQSTGSTILPRQWQISVTAGDATSYAYSVGYSLML